MSYANSTIDENDLSPKISTTQIKRKKRATNSNKYKSAKKNSSNGNKKKTIERREKVKKIEDVIENDDTIQTAVDDEIDITIDKENVIIILSL